MTTHDLKHINLSILIYTLEKQKQHTAYLLLLSLINQAPANTPISSPSLYTRLLTHAPLTISFTR
ncbi:hypothetical protein Hanom_Chr16g01455891 [Helianthus anomalus]